MRRKNLIENDIYLNIYNYVLQTGCDLDHCIDTCFNLGLSNEEIKYIYDTIKAHAKQMRGSRFYESV